MDWLWAIIFSGVTWWSEMQAAEQAAWFQAIGSVVAIVVPIVLWGSDRGRRRREISAKAAAARLSLLPPMRIWLARINGEIDLCSENPDSGGRILESQPMPPKEIQVHYQLIADLDKEGSTIASLITLASKLHSSIEDHRSRYTTTNSNGEQEMNPPLRDAKFQAVSLALRNLHKLITKNLSVVVEDMERALVRDTGRPWRLS